MVFTSAHMVEFAVAVVTTIAAWVLLHKRIGRKAYVLVAIAIMWCGIFSTYLAAQVIPSKEYVKIIATGEKNPLSTVNEICVLGYNANDQWHDLTPPVEGRWAWYPGSEGADYYYAGWFPGAKELQPADATDYIVIEIAPGTNRSVVFLTNNWYGIADVEFAASTQRIDTYGNGEVVAAFLPDTTQNFYQQAQMKQMPIAIALYLMLTIAILALLYAISSPEGIKKIKKHQFLFEELVKRDFTLKYKHTILGMVWSILSPLCMFLIMWIVFKDILGSNINHFAIYMFTGQIVFSFFNDATTQGMTSLLDNAGIFTKVNVPKYMFLLSKNVSSLINFGLTLIILFSFTIADGLHITSAYIMLIYPVGCLILFNVGLGLILSAMFVFFRDMQYLWGIFSQLIMWVSGIFYSVTSLDKSLQGIFLLNPIYSFISYFRSIIIDNAIPSLETHLVILGYSLLVVGVGAFIYKKFNHEFLYYI